MKKTNVDVNKLIGKLKKVSPKPSLSEDLTKALVHPEFRVRDMRQEAMDLGSHMSKEMFGGGDGRTV